MTPLDQISGERFMSRYGTMVEEVHYKQSILALYFYPIYILRRLLYAVTLIVGRDYPIAQLLITIFVLILPVYSSIFIPSLDARIPHIYQTV